jgi:hypothetical protein
MQTTNYFTINGSNIITPFSLIISPAITVESYSLKGSSDDEIMYIISKHIRKAYHDELGIINFNHFHSIISDLTQLTKNDIITKCLSKYFGGHMYRLKEEPPDELYNYSARKRGKNVVYRLITGKDLIDYAQENGYSTDAFRSKFLRQHAITTIDSTGIGIKKDEGNADVYIVGWKLINDFTIHI